MISVKVKGEDKADLGFMGFLELVVWLGVAEKSNT
jgi:hypothetical protein